MTTILRIPPGKRSLAWFRDWYARDDFPEAGRISYLAGELVIDIGFRPDVRAEWLRLYVIGPLARLADELDRGTYLGNGARIVNVTADYSVEPDGCYLAYDSYRSGRYHLKQTPDGEDYSEIVGTPDMVLEVVSPSSIHEDRTILPQLYRIAGVPEYWLIDVRGDRLEFELNRLTPSGYISVRTSDGWAPSTVFGREFRLDRTPDPISIWQYTLHVRPLS